MIDNLEFQLRTLIKDNVVHCANEVGYLNVNEETTSKQELRRLDAEFENCLGKYSDSFEGALKTM